MTADQRMTEQAPVLAHAAAGASPTAVDAARSTSEQPRRHAGTQDCRTHPALRNVPRRLIMEAQFIYRNRSDDPFYDASAREMRGGPDKVIVYIDGIRDGSRGKDLHTHFAVETDGDRLGVFFGGA
jgi:hypothetical protein